MGLLVAIGFSINLSLCVAVVWSIGLKRITCHSKNKIRGQVLPPLSDRDASGEPDFLFCVLKSIQMILKYGKENNMLIMFNNLMEC